MFAGNVLSVGETEKYNNYTCYRSMSCYQLTINNTCCEIMKKEIQYYIGNRIDQLVRFNFNFDFFCQPRTAMQIMVSVEELVFVNNDNVTVT